MILDHTLMEILGDSICQGTKCLTVKRVDAKAVQDNDETLRGD